MLHPWAIVLGLAAVGLPVFIHWLTRPRPVRFPASTLRFIRETIRQRRAMHRLRDLLILGLRTLAVVLLAWAFARPLTGQRHPPLVDARAGGDAQRVVILDVSQSMAARERSIPLFEKARPLAARYLAYSPGLRANLILAGAKPKAIFDRPSANVAVLREELARIQPRPERTNAQAALLLASQMLGQSDSAARKRELVIVSDFQKSSWANADFSPLPADTLIQLESVASPDAPGNLALLSVTSQGRSERGAEVKVDAEVGNYSPAPRQVQAEFVIGSISRRATAICPANGRTTLSATLMPGEEGWQAGEVRLVDVDDALPADNARPFVVDVRPPITYALITRQPGAIDSSASYYLERALAPIRPDKSRSHERVVRVDPAQIDADSIAPADLLVVVQPGKLADKAIDLLMASIRRGRPLLYVAAEPADATNLKLLTEAAGTELRMPVEFLPSSPSRPRRDLRLAGPRADAPAFACFGDSLAAAVAPLRFANALESRPLEGRLTEDVWAAYNDRSAFLVVTELGDASIAVLNADLAASNLPASTAFVPLINELAGSLIGKKGLTREWLCGEPASIALPVDTSSQTEIKVAPPTSDGEPGTLAVENGNIIYRSATLAGPGTYRVNRGDKTCFAFCSAIPPTESDLRCLDAGAMKTLAAGGHRVDVLSTAAEEETRDTIWVWLGVACIGCMLVELIGLKALRT